LRSNKQKIQIGLGEKKLAKCRNCGKEIDKETAYKVGKVSYYCNEQCYQQTVQKRNKQKDKYESQIETERRSLTDYIQSIYLQQGYDRSEIPWQLLMSQTKNILSEHLNWSYTSIQYILYYMYEVLELNLFAEESNGSILSLLPFYGIEAEKYYNQTEKISQAVDDFEFDDSKVVVKKINRKVNHKMIDIGKLI
jgi:YHS domain-containing protein